MSTVEEIKTKLLEWRERRMEREQAYQKALKQFNYHASLLEAAETNIVWYERKLAEAEEEAAR